MLRLQIKIAASAPRELMTALHEATQRISNGELDYQDAGEGWKFFYEVYGEDGGSQAQIEGVF